MRAEMQHGISSKIFAHPAIESRESMGWCKALFKEQAHRVAFIAKGWLHADEDIAELRTQHEDRRAIALLATRRWAPLRFDLVQIDFTAHMIIG